ncbi:hypothetical protein [Shewanella hanedai]|uniref:Uncharacterized protein n=1 Tax=Shewanella hanedai TaxID=25 RepID=A0A553JTP7_SHEHA|nr:hypothetical protein [Shewanella hanedai]TRY15832.1 hypothetical protein FN961_02280 [Shewanella hanedai]
MNFESFIDKNEISAHTTFYFNGELTDGISLTRNKNLNHRRCDQTVRVTLDYFYLRANSKIHPVHSNNKYGEVVHESNVRLQVDKNLQNIERKKLEDDPSVISSNIGRIVFDASQTDAFRSNVEIETQKELTMNQFSPSGCNVSKHSTNGQPWSEEFHVGPIQLVQECAAGTLKQARKYIAKIEIDQGSRYFHHKIENWCIQRNIIYGWLK